MKTLTIGRGEGCDIYIDDYRISRRHALLKIHTFGKMEIVDMGKNGTWVNGVKLRSGVPFPVKRKDVVNIAEATQLNWDKVSDPMKYFRIGGIIVGIVIIAILAIVMIVKALSISSSSSEYEESAIESSVGTEQHSGGNLITDSVTVAPQSGSKQEETTKKEKPRDNGKKTLQELFPEKPKVKKEEPKKEDGKTTKDKKSTGKKTDDKGKSNSKPNGKSYEIL